MRTISLPHPGTAIGAEKYYTLENNATRTETVPVAQELDKKTQRAWLGHSSHHVIDNSTNFEGKLQKLVNTAAKLVGLPTLTRLTTKFLVQEGLTLDEILSKIPEEIEYQVFDIEKVYLYENKGEKRKVSERASEPWGRREYTSRKSN